MILKTVIMIWVYIQVLIAFKVIFNKFWFVLKTMVFGTVEIHIFSRAILQIIFSLLNEIIINLKNSKWLKTKNLQNHLLA